MPLEAMSHSRLASLQHHETILTGADMARDNDIREAVEFIFWRIFRYLSKKIKELVLRIVFFSFYFLAHFYSDYANVNTKV